MVFYILARLSFVQAIVHRVIALLVDSCNSIDDSHFNKTASRTLIFILLLLFIFMHLLLEDSLIEILKQDSNEKVEQDLLSYNAQQYEENDWRGGTAGPIEVLENRGDSVVSQYYEDGREGV